jgi:hypothetical protein
MSGQAMRPSELKDEILREMANMASDVRIFWQTMRGQRQQWSKELEGVYGNVAIIPLIPRGGEFGDPNSIVSDFMEMLDGSKEEIDRVLETSRRLPLRYGFIIVEKAPLRHAQLSSVVKFPEWLPFIGGRLLDCFH